MVLDEDPDNAEALHAVHILLDGLSSDLPTFLGQALSSLEVFVERGNHEGAETGCFWQNLSAHDINPRMLSAFLHQLVSSVNLFPGVQLLSHARSTRTHIHSHTYILHTPSLSLKYLGTAYFFGAD